MRDHAFVGSASLAVCACHHALDMMAGVHRRLHGIGGVVGFVLVCAAGCLAEADSRPGCRLQLPSWLHSYTGSGHLQGLGALAA